MTDLNNLKSRLDKTNEDISDLKREIEYQEEKLELLKYELEGNIKSKYYLEGIIDYIENNIK